MTIIAIVGGGPAGLSLCIQLYSKYRDLRDSQHIEIIIFEKSNDIGFGLPYKNNETSYRINLPKKMMDIIPEENCAFSTWINSSANLIKNNNFPPRHYFGLYLNYRAKEIQKNAEKQGVKISFLTEHEVTNIKADSSEKFKLHINHNGKNKIYTANYVVLSIGHIPNSNFQQFTENPTFQQNPWDKNSYNKISTNDTVGIIGSRLTAIDIALKLREVNHKGKICMVSRSGLLPTVKNEGLSRYNFKYLTSHNFKNLLRKSICLDDIVKLIEQELSCCLGYQFSIDSFIKHARHYNPLDRINFEINRLKLKQTNWQTILSTSYQFIAHVWPLLSFKDQSLYVNKYHSIFMTYLCSSPLESALTIQNLLVNKQLHVYRDLTGIQYQNLQYQFSFKKHPPIFTQHLINACGSGQDIKSIFMLKEMLKQNLISNHPLGGIGVDPRTLCSINAEGKSNSRIYALGDLVKGACFINIEVKRVTEQAKKISQQIISNVIKTNKLTNDNRGVMQNDND